MGDDPAAPYPSFRSELETLSYRYHVHHPFDKLLQSGRATREMLRMWAANRYYYQNTIPRKDAAILANCPDSEMRGMWCKHVITHDLDGALSEWLLLTDGLGLTREEVIRGDHVLHGTKFACDAYLNFCKEETWMDGMCASMTHLFAGDIHKKRIESWPQKYPWLPDSAFTYFRQRQKTLPSEVESTLRALSAHYASTEEGMERAKQILRFKQDVLWGMMDSLWTHFFCPNCAMPKGPEEERKARMGYPPFLRILGSGAGGGVPQWNGNDEWNRQAREGIGTRRSQCSAAICVRKGEWLLINCSPDFRQQWNDLLLHYPGSRLVGILLTDAELDHVGGLLSLRESKDPVVIYATRSIRSNVEATSLPSLLRTYTSLEWRDDYPVETSCIAIKRPKYSEMESDVLCLSLSDRVLYCPCVPTEEGMLSLLNKRKTGDVVLTDGTFETEEEMPSVRGHLPVSKTLSLASSRPASTPLLFTRLNHTNRMREDLAVRDGDEIQL